MDHSAVTQSVIDTALKNNQFVLAVKYYRSLYGVGLKEAKRAIDLQRPKKIIVRKPIDFPTKLFLVSFIVTALALVTQNGYLITISLVSIFIIGCMIAICSIKETFISVKCVAWPLTKCRINDSSVSEESLSNSNRKTYTAHFELGYEVNGIYYDYQYCDLNRSFSSSIEADDYIQLVNNSDDDILTHYNPLNPAQSRVTSGFEYITIVQVLTGIGMSTVSLLTLIGAIKWN